MIRPRLSTFLVLVQLILSGALAKAESPAAPPLHERIDALVGAGRPEYERVAAKIASDAEFARRITLDLTGVIPTASAVRRFEASSKPDKRQRLVDELLASPEYARRMQYFFDTMLMERRPAKHVKAEQWREYLRTAFAEHKPWDALARELLTADGADSATRPAARFLLDRELKIDDMTRDLGRVFLGRDFQCAQCHDHPNVEEYRQRHYHGLAAFLNRAYLFTDPKTKQASIGEKAEGVVKFTSVFTNESGEAAPRLLELAPIEDPPQAAEPYRVKPAKNVRSIPVYSRRLRLAEAMLDPANRAFRRNIANRLWALMMGRGLVEPLDMMHADNPPTHPELLDELADALAEHCYDIPYLLRELALTKTYQRSSQLPDEAPANTDSPDTDSPDADSPDADSPDAESSDTGSSDAESSSGPTYAVAAMKPLTPEQLAWSMMRATGVIGDGGDGGTTDAQAESHVATFAQYFGVIGVQTSQFDASANQALFLRNSALIQGWVHQLAERLSKLEGLPLAEEFCYRVFSRPPTATEAAQWTGYVEGEPSEGEPNTRETRLRELVWAAITSAEFRFNH